MAGALQSGADRSKDGGLTHSDEIGMIQASCGFVRKDKGSLRRAFCISPALFSSWPLLVIPAGPPPYMGHDRVSSSRRGYNARWQRYRERYLIEHPLCVECKQRGVLTVASVVDHIEPHQGDHKLFWNPANHQPLCKPCHDRHKQRLEKSGRSVGCDAAGIPADPRHHWRRG